MQMWMVITMTDLRKLLSNQSGVALMMVMASILVLTALMIDFTYEGQINKLKGVNIEDKGQARLTAEAGLKFAMTRLRLYKEAYNFIQENDGARDFASQEVINSIWNFPFIYPIPIQSNMNAIQKDLIAKFHESTILRGQMRLTIKNISNLINLNLIRVSLREELENEQNPDDNQQPNEEDNQFNAESQLIETLKLHIERKSEQDDEFAAQYFGMEVVPLVNNLKFYVSDPQSLQDDGGASADFSAIPLAPKQGPMTSYQELYTLPGWTDDLAEIIQGEFTIHGAVMIDLNEINDTALRLLIPGINEDEVKEFFEFRDDNENPHFFNSLDDFKNYIVSQANLMSGQDFDERFSKFEAQGLQFGPSPTLFKVASTGEVGRAAYNLVAYVVMPARPKVINTEANNTGDNNTTNPDDPNDPNNPTNPDDPNDNTTDNNDDNNSDEEKQKTLLLEPRIVEIFIN
jgi:hypothetical protein